MPLLITISPDHPTKSHSSCSPTPTKCPLLLSLFFLYEHIHVWYSHSLMYTLCPSPYPIPENTDFLRVGIFSSYAQCSVFRPQTVPGTSQEVSNCLLMPRKEMDNFLLCPLFSSGFLSISTMRTHETIKCFYVCLSLYPLFYVESDVSFPSGKEGIGNPWLCPRR